MAALTMPRAPERVPGDGSGHIVPFYSATTLEDLHVLVKDLHDGLAVYISKDHGVATIGTRGIRPLDGISGLIIHLSFRLGDEDFGKRPRVVLDRPFHNEEHTPATADQLVELLLGSLEKAVLLPAGLSKDDVQARCF